MRSALFLALCLALPVAVAGEAKPAPELYTADAVGTIEVAADGTVVDVDVTTDLGNDLGRALERRIRKWRFAPREAGAPVARGRLDLGLRAVQSADSVVITIPRVHVADVPGERVDGPAIVARASGMERTAKIEYPQKELAQALGARLIAIIRIGADGTPDEFTLEHAEVHDNRGRTDAARREQALARFAKVAEAAVLQWRFPTLPPGDRVRLPIVFQRTDLGGAWMLTHDMPVVPEPWHDKDTRVGDLGPGGAPASQALRLETDPAAL